MGGLDAFRLPLADIDPTRAGAVVDALVRRPALDVEAVDVARFGSGL